MNKPGEKHAPLRDRRWLSLLTEAGRVAGMGSLIGLSAALLANGFLAALIWLNEQWLDTSASLPMPRGSVLTLVVPVLGGLIVALMYRGLPRGSMQGPADVIALVQTRQGKLATRPAVTTGLASLVSLGSGASVGQYGPLVHIGGVLGSWWSRSFGMDRSLGNVAVAAGVAAAISSAFNAPLAGILFAHEIILRHFSLRAFAPIAVASIVGYVGAQTFLAQPPLFQISYTPEPLFWEYGLFLVLGGLSAFVAVLYMRSILWTTKIAAISGIPVLIRLPLAGLALGAVGVFYPEILGVGLDTLRRLFAQPEIGLDYLAVIFVLKLTATAWCLGMGFSGGVFSPALMVGSLFGLLFAGLVDAIPGVTLSAFVEYAICGMMAVTSPVIGAPLSAIVIVFELTGNYQLTVAAMASVAMANLISARIFGRSFFDLQLRTRGLDLSGGRSKALLSTRTLGDLIKKEELTLLASVSVGQAVTALGEAQASEATLLGPTGDYQGTVRLHTLVSQQHTKPARNFRARPEVVLRADSSLWRAMQKLKEFKGERVPVVDANRHWIGSIAVQDLISCYLRLLSEIREEEHEAR